MDWWIFALLGFSAVACLSGGITAVLWRNKKYDWSRRCIAIAKDAVALTREYEDALVTIASRKEAYCPEMCEHKTCEQSHYATMIAHRALKNTERAHKEEA